MTKNIYGILLPAFIACTAISCNKDEDTPPPAPTVVREWTIPLSAKNEVPAPARNETGTATMQLMSDNSVKYTINVTGLASGDALTAAHLHVGNVITSGGVILGLNPVFTGSTASGTIAAVRASLIDSLKDNANEIYFNVHSTQVPAGLVRGQLNIGIEMVADVVLNGANEVPAGTTAATGLATLRLTSDKKLYVKATVTNIEVLDALTGAHVHAGATGVNGPILVGFYSNAADFGTVKIIAVNDANFASLKADPIYVNVHSTTKPLGLIRGQIR